MPPKKAEATEGGAAKFTWDGANENKLMLIIMGRHVSTAEFEDVAKAFPGATGGAIRNRIGILRAKQKKVYEELGWDLPGSLSGPASAAKAPASAKKTPAKRASDDSGEGEGLEAETPSKKKRAPRTPRKKKEAEKKDSGAEDEKEGMQEMGGGGGGVKKEVVEEEEEEEEEV